MVEPTTFQKFRKVMFEMYRGYPDYVFWGIFEEEFGSERGKHILKILSIDELIIGRNTEKGKTYKLTKKGLDFVFAMLNSYLAQKTQASNTTTSRFTKILGWSTVGLMLYSFSHLMILLWF